MSAAAPIASGTETAGDGAIEVIRIGDRVCLEPERLNSATGTARFVCTASAASSIMCAKEHSELEVDGFWSRAIFVVQAKSTWTRLQAFKMLLEQTGVSLLEAQGHPETRAAYVDVQSEFELHEREFDRAKGREVRYGSVIQLLHDAGSQWLSTSRQSVGGGGNRMLLDSHAGESGWFRVMPRLRVHNEGERVRTGDPIVLEAIETGQRITLSTGLDLLSVEPSADTGASSSFRLRLFRSVEENSLDGALMCGHACTFFHKEFEGYLSCGSGQAKVTMSPSRGTRQQANSMSIWQIQAENERVGSACKWEGKFRLRHASSLRFLAVRNVPADGVEDVSSLAVTLVGTTEGRNDPEATLFRFVPQYPLEGNIMTGHFFQIAHVHQGAFLHALSSRAKTDEAAGDSPEDAGESEDGEARGQGNQADSSEIQLVATRLAHDTDIFSVRVIEMAQLRDLNFGLAALRPFDDFLRQVRELQQANKDKKTRVKLRDAMFPAEGEGEAVQELLDHVEQTMGSSAIEESVDAQMAGYGLDKRPLTQAISDLICFVTQSDNADPYTREGMPIETRQVPPEYLYLLPFLLPLLPSPLPLAPSSSVCFDFALFLIPVPAHARRTRRPSPRSPMRRGSL